MTFEERFCDEILTVLGCFSPLFANTSTHLLLVPKWNEVELLFCLIITSKEVLIHPDKAQS